MSRHHGLPTTGSPGRCRTSILGCMRTRWQRVNRSLSVSEPSHLDFLRPACQQSAQHADSSATANHVSAFLGLHTLPALLWPPRKTAGWNGGALGMGGLAKPLHKFVQDCTLCQQSRCGQHLCALDIDMNCCLCGVAKHSVHGYAAALPEFAGGF